MMAPRLRSQQSSPFRRITGFARRLPGRALSPLLLPAQPACAASSGGNLTALSGWLVAAGLSALVGILLFKERKHSRRIESQQDQSDKKLSQLQLLLNLERNKLVSLIEALPLPVYSKDPQGLYLFCNQAFCDYLQHPREQIIGRSAYDLLPHDLADIHSRADQQLAEKAGRICYQASLPHATGMREVLFNKSAHLGRDGKLREIFGLMTDITDLNNSQIFLSNILNAISYPVFVKDDQSRYQVVNQALNDFVGYTREEMLGKTDFDLYPQREAQRFTTTDQLALQEQEPISYESTITSKQGSAARINVRKKVFKDNSGSRYLVGVYHDVTSLYQAREKMASLQTLLYSIIDSMPSLIIAIDILEQVTQWNHRAEEFSGVSAAEAIGKQLADVFPFHADLEPLIAKALETAQAQHRQKARWQVGERQHFVDIISYPLSAGGLEGVVIRADNVDERVRMEEMMIFTEKMVSIGSLAAGMAHEINNPLAIMIQNAQVLHNRLLERLPKNDAVAEECGIGFEQLQQYLEARNISTTLDSILQSGARASKIVADMVNFAQRRVSCYSPCRLAALVKQTLALAASDFDLKKKYNFRDVEIEVDVPPELPTLHCETDQIQQVLLNLLRNGAQSMAENPRQQQPPKFTIRARAMGNRMRLEVSDNGPGIDEKIQKQIFDPFFSTRPVGTGTGLGLAASYFIVTEKHGGSIRVESESGKGSRFIIELPLTGQPHE